MATFLRSRLPTDDERKRNNIVRVDEYDTQWGIHQSGVYHKDTKPDTPEVAEESAARYRFAELMSEERGVSNKLLDIIDTPIDDKQGSSVVDVFDVTPAQADKIVSRYISMKAERGHDIPSVAQTVEDLRLDIDLVFSAHDKYLAEH